jgi:CRISPR/Cas system-associated exonuclease Cas4 (RecB family)
MKEDSYDPDFNVREEINRILEEENNRPWSRKKGSYHPSAIGGCRRALYYDRIGEEPVQTIYPSLRMLFGLGHAIHDFVQESLGHSQRVEFSSEVAARHKELDIYGRCDGVFYEKGWLLEIKTIGDSSYRTLIRPKKNHLLQAHCYMKALGVPRIQILYVNRDSGNMREFRVHFDDDVWKEIEGTIAYVERHIAEDIAPPREESFFNCRSCKFAHVCKPPVYS